MHFTTALAASAAFLTTLTCAHMEMSKPYPIRSKYDPANKSGGNIDYSMTAPLEASGSNYPCKGYQNDPNLHSVATYQAGSQYSMEISGSAVHNGGSCQLSLSYDGGKTFKVIKSMIGSCPITKNYDFTIPSYAPNGTALFAWTWENHTGNREFYMNCAVVDIQSSNKAASSKTRRDAGKSRRDNFSSFEQLPTVWQANMPSVNKCTTQEGTDPVYPHPGPDVVYGAGSSSSSAPDGQSDCDAVVAGPTYKGALSAAGASEDAGGSAGSGSGSATAPSPVASYGAGNTGGQGLKQKGVASPTIIVPTAAKKTAAATPTAVQAPVQAPATGSDSGSAAPGPSSGSSNASSGETSPAPVYSAPASPAASGSSCSNPGEFQCTNGGKGFAVCNQGTWVDMGSVAAGMKCDAGKMVLDLGI